MLIEITQDHIVKGESTCSHCPIALAIAEHIKENMTVGIDSNHCHIHERGCVKKVRLPNEAIIFYNNFDKWIADPSRECPGPFAFELAIPQECLKC